MSASRCWNFKLFLPAVGPRIHTFRTRVTRVLLEIASDLCQFHGNGEQIYSAQEERKPIPSFHGNGRKQGGNACLSANDSALRQWMAA